MKKDVKNPWILCVFKIKSDMAMRWNPRWAYHDYRPRKTKPYLRFYFIHNKRFLFVIEVWHKCIESELSFERYFRCIHLFYFEPLKAKVISFSRTSFFPSRKCSFSRYELSFYTIYWIIIRVTSLVIPSYDMFTHYLHLHI